MIRKKSRIMTVAALGVAVLTTAALAAVPSPKPPKEPASVEIEVSPDAVAPGEALEVTMRLKPKSGIKINKYPRISLKVAAVDGVVAAGEAEVGSESPPSPEAVERGANYFTTVEPLKLTLSVERSAKPGPHEVSGKLKYYYCVTASGFCAPQRAEVKIPIVVR